MSTLNCSSFNVIVLYGRICKQEWEGSINSTLVVLQEQGDTGVFILLHLLLCSLICAVYLQIPVCVACDYTCYILRRIARWYQHSCCYVVVVVSLCDVIFVHYNVYYALLSTGMRNTAGLRKIAGASGVPDT